MKKIMSISLSIVMLLSVVIFAGTIISSEDVTQVIEGFESFNTGDDIFESSGDTWADGGVITATVEDIIKNSETSKAMKVTYVGENETTLSNWSTLRVTSIANDWSGAKKVRFYIDMTGFDGGQYSGTGLYIKLTSAGVVYSLKNEFTWNKGDGSSVNELYGAVWVSVGGYNLGYVEISLDQFASSSGDLFSESADLTDVQAFGIEFSGWDDLEGKSFYIDDISLLVEAQTSESSTSSEISSSEISSSEISSSEISSFESSVSDISSNDNLAGDDSTTVPGDNFRFVIFLVLTISFITTFYIVVRKKSINT